MKVGEGQGTLVTGKTFGVETVICGHCAHRGDCRFKCWRKLMNVGGVRVCRSVCVRGEPGAVTSGEKKEGRGEHLSQGIHALVVEQKPTAEWDFVARPER